MGQFANTLFSVLLGWVQTAASWLWALVIDSNVNQGLHWMLEHWLQLVLALCVGGLVLDFVVYLIRWQPYRVWRNFLRRRREGDNMLPEEQPQPVYQRRWVYADGSIQVEDVQAPLAEHATPELQLAEPIRPTRRLARRATLEQSYNQPVYPPQWRHDHQGENE